MIGSLTHLTRGAAIRAILGARKPSPGRCVLSSTGPFPRGQEWKSLVATMEEALRLYRHKPGSLATMDKYMHKRTGGMIGSLSHLIRAAAITAILDGSEEITRDLLDSIALDHGAESSGEGAA